jgi:hypothetical protein
MYGTSTISNYRFKGFEVSVLQDVLPEDDVLDAFDKEW